MLSRKEAINKIFEEHGEDAFSAGIGAEAILEILKSVDLKKESEN